MNYFTKSITAVGYWHSLYLFFLGAVENQIRWCQTFNVVLWCVLMNGEYAQPQHISDTIYLGAAIVLSIIGIVGFLFNTCVIFIMIRDPRVNNAISLIKKHPIEMNYYIETYYNDVFDIFYALIIYFKPWENLSWVPRYLIA